MGRIDFDPAAPRCGNRGGGNPPLYTRTLRAVSGLAP